MTVHREAYINGAMVTIGALILVAFCGFYFMLPAMVIAAGLISAGIVGYLLFILGVEYEQKHDR